MASAKGQKLLSTLEAGRQLSLKWIEVSPDDGAVMTMAAACAVAALAEVIPPDDRPKFFVAFMATVKTIMACSPKK